MLIKVFKVVKYLEENPNSYLREIARDLGLSSGSVHRVLRKINDFIEIKSIDQDFGVSLPRIPIFIKLKDGVTAEGLANYFLKKKKLEEALKV